MLAIYWSYALWRFSPFRPALLPLSFGYLLMLLIYYGYLCFTCLYMSSLFTCFRTIQKGFSFGLSLFISAYSLACLLFIIVCGFISLLV
ncbi:hypothetical protein BJ508DRAFT_175568 [Ascobolus immersus RN42]|uniref:Uncharacterized protein n=1 Tax=Ascobolus immersus RN42 TaxID=1160509 RepID=A0A3N4HYS0_ASCIM|nr:hypothetical protein BJ508DRAFT_175568 [Ascobolus immersus RN42]